MNELYYDLYENNTFVKRISDKEYALFWILDNFIKSEYTLNYHFDIVKISANDMMCSESIKICDNKVIKINKYNNEFNTSYSPYDLDLFNSTELSLLYQNIINKNIINKNITNNQINITTGPKALVIDAVEDHRHSISYDGGKETRPDNLNFWIYVRVN